jgi:large subunit ribosomal protein L9
MEVILKQDITNLGNKDDIVTVKGGYGRNYLIPRGLAVMATETEKKVHKEILRQRAHKEAKLREDAEKQANNLGGVELKIGAKTSSTGKIFGSVNNIQIAEALSEKGYDIDRKNISISGDAIKEIGTYKAVIKLYKDIKTEITFEVFSE